MISGGRPGTPVFVGGVLARLAHDQLDLCLGLGDDLLDATRVDAAVLDELGQAQPGDLASDGVEAADQHGLGRVVDDQVDPGGLLEGADVAPLAADDAALHLVTRQLNDADRHLGRVVDHDALDRSDHDVACLFLSLFLGFPLDSAGQPDGVVLSLLANLLEQQLLGLVL